MFEHNKTLEKAVSFSRFDTSHFLSTCSDHPFDLDDKTWACAEYYYHANMVKSPIAMRKILAAPSGKVAHKIGSAWYRPKRKDWKTVRQTMMTRALYTKAMAHPEVKAALLETDNRAIVETSMYDHYWGLGRDQRGENTLGKIWMNIRDKIRQDESASLKQNMSSTNTAPHSSHSTHSPHSNIQG